MGAPRSHGGFKIHADDHNALADYVDQITPIGPAVSQSPTRKGRYIEFPPPPPLPVPAAAVPAVSPPADFALYDASSDGALKVGVRFGLVQCYRTSDDVAPWPSNYTNGVYEFPVGADGAVWIELNNDTSDDYYQVTEITMNHGVTPPTVDASSEEEDDVTGVIVCGTWSIADGKIVPGAGWGAAGIGNQAYNFCGYGQFVGPL